MTAPSRERFEPTRRLTPAQFRVVALLWHDEMSYPLIADRLGIETKTVRMHVEHVARWLPGHGHASWKVLRHAEKLLEMGFGDPAKEEEAA